MGKLAVLLIILVPNLCSAIYKLNPDFHSSEKFFVYKDRAYTVPVCRKVLLQDISQIGERAWVEIDGAIQIAETFNFSSAPSHLLNGKFTYSTSSGSPKQKVIVLPGATITVRSHEPEARLPVVRFMWIGEEDCLGSGEL